MIRHININRDLAYSQNNTLSRTVPRRQPADFLTSHHPMQPCRPFKRRFSAAEDAALCNLVSQFGTNQWTKIAEFIPERTPRQCRDRYQHYLVLNMSDHPWTAEEDARLRQAAQEYGHRWKEIAGLFTGRNANSLKNRWHKVVGRLDAKRPNQPPDEDDVTEGSDHSWDQSVIDDPLSLTYFDCCEDSLHDWPDFPA
jgi:hypothetical protein